MYTENETLNNFIDMMHSMEEFRDMCKSSNRPALADKWQGVLDAFSHFTEQEVIEMEEFLN